jgi:glycosyltransferase involved in cell wall biosynthesis
MNIKSDRKLKVAIDGRVLQRGMEGVSRTVLQLLSGLKDKVEFYVILAGSKKQIHALNEIPEIVQYFTGPRNKLLGWVWENFFLPLKLKKINANIYHAPCNTGLPFFRISNIAYVVTIHDLVVDNYPSCATLFGLINWKIGIKNSVNLADRIIADSQCTAKDLVSKHSVRMDKVSVIYPSLNEIFFIHGTTTETSNRLFDFYGIGCPYIVYHGGFREYKDVARVVAVYNKVRKMNSIKLQLCLIGKKNEFFDKFVNSAIEESEYKEDIVLTGFVDDADLIMILKASFVHLFLSKFEGFGYPPLEAMACGVPSVCNSVSSMIEVLEHACMWVKPDESPQSIADKIMLLTKDAVLRNRLIDSGHQTAKKYSNNLYCLSILKEYENAKKN